MKPRTQNQNRFVRIITVPIRILSKAKNFYVRSMNDYADKVSYGPGVGGPAAQVTTLPKSFSVSSSRSDEDADMLSRASSTRSMSSRVEAELLLQQQQRRHAAMGSRSGSGLGSTGVPRSVSVGMGRIDEDKACEFGEDGDFVNRNMMYPRSRSYAVNKRRVV